MATETIDRPQTERTEENTFLHVLTGPFARILYSLPFLIFGINHFAQPQNLAPAVPVPGEMFWVYFVGACLIAAGIAIIANRLRLIAGVLLSALLMTFVLTIHVPAILAEGMAATQAVVNLLKDSALAGAALYLAGHPHR